MVFEGDSLEDYMLEYKEGNLVKVELPNVEERNVEKLEKIEPIVARWNNGASHSFSDMCKINEIIKRGKTMKKEIFEETLKQIMYSIMPFSEITIIDGVSIGQRVILIDYYYKGSKYLTKLEYDSRQLELPYTDISEKILDMLVMKLHKEIDKLVVFEQE